MIACFWCGSYRDVHPVRIDGVVQWLLCAACFWRWTETGIRPDITPHAPAAGPNTGLILTPQMLRELR